MPLCPRCGNILSQGETFCGQCGTQIGGAKTTVLGGYIPTPLAPTIPVSNNGVSSKKSLFLILIIVLVSVASVSSFFIGQLTSKGTSPQDSTHQSSTKPTVGFTLPETPTATQTSVPTATATPIPIDLHQGINEGVMHHNDPVLEDGQLRLNLTLIGNTLSGFCTVIVQTGQPPMTCANGIIVGNVSGNSIHFQVEHMIFDGTISTNGTMNGVYSYPPTNPQNDCGNGTWQTSPTS